MRPSWHLDAKWLAALAAVALVFAASVSYTLYRLTAHDTATGAFTAIAVSMLEDKVDGGEWDRIRTEAAANPQTEYYVPGVNVTVTGAEIAESTLPQALELVVGRAADTLYYEGSDAAEPLFAEEPKEGAQAGGRLPAKPLTGDAADPPAEGGEARSLDTGPFTILSQDSHDFLQPLVYAFAVIALAPLAALALFSRRFGRLGSPAAAVLAGVAPAALLSTIAGRAASRAGEPSDFTGRLGEAIAPALSDLSNAFLIVAAVAAGAIALAVLGHAGAWMFGRLRSPREEDEEEAAAAPLVPPPPTYVSEQGFTGYNPADKGAVGPGGVPQT